MSQPQLRCTLGRGAYLAGDTVHCEITLSAPPPSVPWGWLHSHEAPVVVDFISAQLHGHVSFDPRRVSFDEEANKARRMQRRPCVLRAADDRSKGCCAPNVCR